MLYATNRFPGDGTTTQYEISFVGGYLDRAHVKAYIEGADLVQTPVTLSPGNFLGQYTIGGIAPVPVGSTLVIYRDTPKAPIVDFVNGSRFTESNLDTATRQGSFIAAEGADAVSPTGLAGVINQIEGFSSAAGVARDQAVLSAGQAAVDAVAAGGSASAAGVSAAQALNNRLLTDTYAASASLSADNAAISKTDADSARDAASLSAASALDSKNAAQSARAGAEAAAAAAHGGIKAYATHAEAAIAAALLPDGADVEVSQDETRVGARTRYKVQAGALVFVVNLDQTKLDLAAATGASLVGTADSVGLWTTVQGFITKMMSSAGGSVVGFIQSGIGAILRTLQDKGRDTLHIKDYGGVCDGIADDTQALVDANAAAVAQGKTLLISGTPLIKSALVFTTKSSWRFDGASGTTDADIPASYLIKHSSVAGTLLTFSAEVVLDGLAIVGQAGNTGDGLALWGHSPQVLRPFVTKMGQDGIRIGRDSLDGSNVNCFYITNPRCVFNGRDGIHISDKPTNTFGLYDANAGILVAPRCSHNTRHGIYGGAARLGNTILTPTCEGNGQYGIYLSALFYENKIIGGDTEANGFGDLFQTNKYDNDICGLMSTGKNVNTRAVLGSYVPVVTGATSAGACTYTTQLGSREVSGPTCTFRVHIAWTGHTGTGQMCVNLPETCYVTVPCPDYIPVSVVGNGMSIAAGAQFVALIMRDTNRIQLYQSNAGVVGASFVGASGELFISGSYPINAPNTFTA